MLATNQSIGTILQQDTKLLKSKLLTILAKQSYKEGKVTLVSGKESNYYIDGKLTTLDAEGGTLVSILLLRMLKESVTAIGGISVGACPLSSGISQISYLLGKKLNAFYIRKEPKKHGTMKWIEGPIKPFDKVAILEDVVTTGISSLKAVERVKEFGCTVEQVISMVDRNEGGREVFKRQGLDYNYLFDIQEVIERSKISR
ncbi:MAG: orotate phosphoribosyltransferase [Candidatus Melainabacteria bacterium]|nr:orotate phosphoribosyltransferase [Candidatus Melainabacteria bacterium]